MGICESKPAPMAMEEVCSEKVMEQPAKEEAAAEPEPTLTVTIMGARGLRDADWMPGTGKSDCYCVLKAVGKDGELYRTQAKKDALEPVWNEEATVFDYVKGDDLELSVWDEGADQPAALLGRVKLERSAFEAVGFNGDLQLQEAGKGITAHLRLKVKMAGQEYPPGPPREFTISMERDPAKKLGLELDSQDGIYAFVGAVRAGPFQDYNQNVKAAEQLKPGDFIFKVNGEAGNAKKLVDDMAKSTTLEIVVCRPAEVRIAIDKKDAKKKLGLDFPKNPAGAALLIANVLEGAFQEWNAAHEGYEVKAGDRIVAVGAFRGTPVELHKQLAAASKGGKMQVTIARPAFPESPSSWWYV